MLSAIVLSMALMTQNQGTALDFQWARTSVPWKSWVDGDVDAAPEVLTSTLANAAVLFRMPVQVQVSCSQTGGSHYYACWSQNPETSISSGFVYGADQFGVYDSNHGPCTFATSGTPMFYTGAIQAMFRPQFHNGVMPAGARLKTCSATAEPCADDTECTSGTCSLAKLPDTVYLFIGCSDEDCDCVVTEAR